MSPTANPVRTAFAHSRSAFWSAGLFTGAINILMLTGPIFMLQVYDRVLASGSVPTLVALAILVGILYAFMAVFMFVRSRILSRTAFKLDLELTPLAQKSWIYAGLGRTKGGMNPVQDLRIMRQFIGGNGLPALFDLPWIPIYLIFVFLLHPWLGWLATFGAVLVTAATFLTEKLTKPALDNAAKWSQQETAFSQKVNNNAEAILSMGMMGNISTHWNEVYAKTLGWTQLAGNRTEGISAIVRALRLTLQSAILGLGAYLAIIQEIGPGAMIAATILAGRALAPIDQAIAHWKPFVTTRQAHARLSSSLVGLDEQKPLTQLPDPKGNLEVSNVAKMTDQPAALRGTNSPPILQGINFSLEPGDALGVMGPSASGKTTLARLLCGITLPNHGSVRIDGATFDQWDRDRIGRHVGYLPQNVELISASLRDNISRFQPDAKDEDIVEAATLAGIHEMILALPDGYETHLGNNPHAISGGQAQRVALARAIYNSPALVVLDEPNSNLDAEGEEALTNAIKHLRKKMSCVIVMAHRPSAIAAVNKVLILAGGKQMEFGPRDEILRKITRAVPKPTQAASGNPIGVKPPANKTKVKTTHGTGITSNWHAATKKG